MITDPVANLDAPTDAPPEAMGPDGAPTATPAPSTARFPIPVRLNVTIIVLQLVALGGIFYAASIVSTWWHVALLALGMALLGNSIYSIIHEAEHRILHPNRRVNDWLGAVMALFFPAPYHLIRQGHIGHHQRNRSDDEAFDLYFDGDSPWLTRIQYYGIITGLYWAMVVIGTVVVLIYPRLLSKDRFEFSRSSEAFMESLNPAYWWLIRVESLAAIALHTGIILALGIHPLIYLAVYFGFGFSWSAMQYVHHFGTQRHVLEGTRNLWLFAPIDVLWLHHNWHRAHHHHPTVPWVYLPGIGREESPKREFLPWQYLRMWRGPRYSDERVDNKYAGRIIR